MRKVTRSPPKLPEEAGVRASDATNQPIGNTARVAEAVESRAVELGFVEGAVEGYQLVSIPVGRDQLVFVVGPDHPWVQSARLTARLSSLIESSAASL